MMYDDTMTICKGCGQPCQVVSIDYGIGAYEYWGATGYDSRVALVSSCCEADYDGEAPEPDYDYEPDYDEKTEMI